jgi:hypothetical protein
VITPHPRCRAGAARRAAYRAVDLAAFHRATLGLDLLADMQRTIARRLDQVAKEL